MSSIERPAWLAAILTSPSEADIPNQELIAGIRSANSREEVMAIVRTLVGESFYLVDEENEALFFKVREFFGELTPSDQRDIFSIVDCDNQYGEEIVHLLNS